MAWFSRKPTNKLAKVSPVELRARQSRNRLQLDVLAEEISRLETDYRTLTQPRRPGESDLDVRRRASQAKQVSDRIKLRSPDLAAHMQADEQYSLLVAYAERVGERAAILDDELERLLRLKPADVKAALAARAKDVETGAARSARRGDNLQTGVSESPNIELDHSEELRLIEEGTPLQTDSLPPAAPAKAKSPKQRSPPI